MPGRPNEPEDPAPAEAGPPIRLVRDATRVRYDVAAEESLIASLMADPTVWPAVEGLVDAGHFFTVAFGHIFAAIAALHSKGTNPWAPQVVDELRRAGLLEQCGGAGGIEAIANNYVPGSRVRSGDAARLIAHYARARRFYAVAEELKETAGRADHSASMEVLQRAAEQLTNEAELAISWMAVDVAGLLEGGITQVLPTMLTRSDDVCLIYPAKTHAFNAEPEAGKSFLAVWLCAERIKAGEHVLYIDFEADAESVLERFLAVGVTEAEAGEFFHYVRPDDPFDMAARARILDITKRFTPTVAVLDGVAEVMAMNAWDENSNTDIAAFLNALPRLLERQNCAVVMIDHLVKDKTNQDRYARGGAHKLAGITGAAYKLEVIEPLARGRVGRIKITVTKDRPGWVRRSSRRSRVGEMEVVSTDNGSIVAIEIKAPETLGDGDTWDGPTHCMDAVLAFLTERVEVEFSQNQVDIELRAKGLSFRRATVLDSLSRLVTTQQVEAREGPRRSRLYRVTTHNEMTLNDF